MIESIRALQQELIDIDMEISNRLIELEKWFEDLHFGVPIPFDDDFAFAKVKKTWRFVRAADKRPVSDTVRENRAKFMERWGTKEKLLVAAEKELKILIEKRRKTLHETQLK